MSKARLKLNSFTGITNCIVEYSGSICPYPPEDAHSNRMTSYPLPLFDWLLMLTEGSFVSGVLRMYSGQWRNSQFRTIPCQVFDNTATVGDIMSIRRDTIYAHWHLGSVNAPIVLVFWIWLVVVIVTIRNCLCWNAVIWRKHSDSKKFPSISGANICKQHKYQRRIKFKLISSYAYYTDTE